MLSYDIAITSQYETSKTPDLSRGEGFLLIFEFRTYCGVGIENERNSDFLDELVHYIFCCQHASISVQIRIYLLLELKLHSTLSCLFPHL